MGARTVFRRAGKRQRRRSPGLLLGGAAFALYPTLLPATTGAQNSLTVWNSAAGPRSLAVGLYWWIPGMLIAIAYFVLVYRTFGGSVPEANPEH